MQWLRECRGMCVATVDCRFRKRTREWVWHRLMAACPRWMRERARVLFSHMLWGWLVRSAHEDCQERIVYTISQPNADSRSAWHFSIVVFKFIQFPIHHFIDIRYFLSVLACLLVVIVLLLFRLHSHTLYLFCMRQMYVRFHRIIWLMAIYQRFVVLFVLLANLLTERGRRQVDFCEVAEVLCKAIEFPLSPMIL